MPDKKNDFSVIIGGKAGEGINQAGSLIGNLLSELGYYVHIDYDYPSLIRGGHNFARVRAADKKIGAQTEKADFVLALNQDAVVFHTDKLKDKKRLIFDPAAGKAEGGAGYPVPLTDIVKEENAIPIMKNTCILGAFARAISMEWAIFEKVLRKSIYKEVELNLKIARRGYDSVQEVMKLDKIGDRVLPMLSGNEAIGLGLVKAGLKAYLAYPMTPSSGVLHYLADKAEEFNIKVIHPENEIAVMLMAQGFAYAGTRAAVGSAGGGFCLMVEGLSLSGIAEMPIAVVVSQRPGPSTGVPTYTCQADLEFVLTAGHGEFLRLVVAPGDPDEAYFWSGQALNIAWKYSIPALILSDKTLSEGSYSFDVSNAGEVKEAPYPKWSGSGEYKRYLNTPDGVSPLAFPGDANAVVKANSYEHDESGITVEDAESIAAMQEKRFKKTALLAEDIGKLGPVNVAGNKDSDTALLCWGSNKRVSIEAAEELGLKVVQPLVLAPFPHEAMKRSLSGAKKVICVENNLTGQLANLVRAKGFRVDDVVLKYDGRPFLVEELTELLKKRI